LRRVTRPTMSFRSYSLLHRNVLLPEGDKYLEQAYIVGNGI